MKIRALCTAGVCASILFGVTAEAARAKRERVEIEVDAPDSALCRETARSVAQLRADIGWPMTALYGRGEGNPDRTVGQLTFHGVHVQSIVFVNSAGEKHPQPLAFYLVDIDNTPPVEMINFVTGGHGATGEGTTLSILKNNLSVAPQPIPDIQLRELTRKIGPLAVRFTGKEFDVGYFVYPFAFSGRNYLFIEGNGNDYQVPQGQAPDFAGARKAAKDLVIELAPDGLATRCYFSHEPDSPAR